MATIRKRLGKWQVQIRRKNLIKALYKNRYKNILDKKKARSYALSFTDKKLAKNTYESYKSLIM